MRFGPQRDGQRRCMPVLWLRTAQSGRKSPKISKCAQHGAKSRNFTVKARDHRKLAGLAQSDLDSLKTEKTNQNGPNAANFTKKVRFHQKSANRPQMAQVHQKSASWPLRAQNHQQNGPKPLKITKPAESHHHCGWEGRCTNKGKGPSGANRSR